jgi:hypothetical protein
VALDTPFSSGRTGWAPPGPGAPASPLFEDDTVLPLAVGVLLAADALGAGKDATADYARSQQSHGTCPLSLAPAGGCRGCTWCAPSCVAANLGDPHTNVPA